ncbi:unnamed protein product [Calicophoron daubneyi]|uniref:Group XV phospholipase A2 n=1 Tax=Calicophoron daubneyi TaxID=300641 RepID=A0AAV2T0E6_CALDB
MKQFVILVLLVIAFGSEYIRAATHKTPKHPLVLVPGITGSRLSISDPSKPGYKEEVIWVNLKYLLNIRELFDKLKLIYDPISGEFVSNPKYVITVPGWGDIYTISILDSQNRTFASYYYPLVKELMKDPFMVPNVTLRGAPYDFRIDPRTNKDFVPKLKQLIEETYTRNGNRRVVLFAHSMGSIVAVRFLNAMTVEWKQKYIETFVTVNGANGGTVKVLKALLSGDNFGAIIIDPLLCRSIERTFTSIYTMLPDPRLFGPDKYLIRAPKANYSAHDYKKLFHDIHHDIGYEIWRNTTMDMDTLSEPTGVDNMYCIYSSELSTTEELRYSKPTGSGASFPDQMPDLTFGDGDGTVNLQSLEFCKKWTNAKHVHILGKSHNGILGSSKLHNLLWEILGQ